MMNFLQSLISLTTLSLMSLTFISPALAQPPREEFHNGLSLQGFTGILNTPSAHVTKEGDFYALYTNQKESKWRDRTPYQDNYLFNVGMFSVLEIGGRLTWAPEVGAKDLSGNVKLSTKPFTVNYPLIPVLGFGMQDLGGGAKFLQTKYVVLSQDIWRLRLSAGYGTGPDRMKGTFAGGEFKAHDWFYLLGDYDTKETNVGARVILPHFWKVPVSFTATAKTSLDHNPGNFDIAFGFSLPLDFKVRDKGQESRAEKPKSAPATLSQNEKNTVTASIATNKSAFTSLHAPEMNHAEGLKKSGEFTVDGSPLAAPKPSVPDKNDTTAKLIALKERLVRAGFLNVRVGTLDGKILVLEYENAMFNHNELDALGIVSGMAVEQLKDDLEKLRIIIKKKNIRMMQVTMPFKAVTVLMESERDLADLRGSMVISNKVDEDAGIAFVGGDDNPSAFTTALVLWPGLNTIVGSEVGAFDYVLSLKPELFVNLWSGGVINARWDFPLSWSDNFDEGKPFRDSRTPGRIERIMLFQGLKLLPDVMANLGAGKLQHNQFGVMNEVVWQPGEGNHRMRLAQSWGKDDSTRKGKEVETFLAAYRYYFSPLDLFLEGTIGKFLSQDRGFSVELKRFFGDAAFSLFYKNSSISEDTAQGYPRYWQTVGVQFAFPLTPQKDMKHYYKMQVRGRDEWNHNQETTIATGNKDNINYLPPVPLAVTPLFTASLHNQYLNRDRLNEAYIKAHLERLREAWLKYRERF